MVMVGIVPYGIVFLGMVMLLKPLLPVGPDTMKLMAVVCEAWLVPIVMLVIWLLVMLPLIWRLTFVPSSFVACTMVGVGVGVGVGIGVGVTVPSLTLIVTLFPE